MDRRRCDRLTATSPTRRQQVAQRAGRAGRSCSITCQLAFDDKVVLKDVSFTLLTGHTKIILGASGSGKSTILKIILGLLRADGGVIWVNGERVDQLTEHEMMAVRADLGMMFQEGALFDSLTVRENVGYKLYEETDMPLDEVDRRVEEVLGFVGLGEYIDRMPSELSGGQRRRVAIARAMAFKPQHPALRRGDDRPRSDHRDDGRRRDHQAARPRERQLDRGHAPAARRVLRRRRTWRCATPDGDGRRSCRRRRRRSARPSSSCCATA